MIQTWLKAFADELTSACSYVDPAAIEHEIATRIVRVNVLAWGFMRRFCEMLEGTVTVWRFTAPVAAVAPSAG